VQGYIPEPEWAGVGAGKRSGLSRQVSAKGEWRLIKYVAEAGDCILSISERHGFFWETLWNHPDNRQVKLQRKDPNVLNPGDVVTIPDLKLREENAAVDQRHRYLRKGTPATLRLQLLDLEGQPREGVNCIIAVDGALTNRTTDGEGRLEVPIRPDAVEAVLDYDDEDGYPVRRRLKLGGVDPACEEKGIRERLANLGHCELGSQDTEDSGLEHAIRSFQESQKIEPTGSLDDETRQKLKATHGS
jgi:N-acetylmuramoyl-L-alanine amidase